MEISDKELIYMIRQGDVASRNLLFEKYKLLIEKFVFEVYNTCKKLDVNDIRQELYICLYKSIDNYTEEKGLFFSYLYASIIHKVSSMKKEYYRSSDANLNLSISLEDISSGIDRKYGDLLEDDALITNPKYSYTIQEVKEEFNNSFSTLSELEKRVIQLYNLGYSREKMIEILNISKKQLDNALSRAKNKLKSINR